MSTLTRHQRHLVLLVMLVIILVSVPAIIVVMKLPFANSSSVAAPLSADRSPGVIAEQEKPGKVEPVFTPKNHSAYNVAVTGEKDDTSSSGDARGFVAGNWVVVDCEQRVVLQCPHKLIDSGTAPRSMAENSIHVLQGHCRDVSINVDSFCRINYAHRD